MSHVDVDTVLKPLPTLSGIPMRPGDFETLCESLDYAAKGKTGLNYFDGKARLKDTIFYAKLQAKAKDMAKRLVLFAEKDARIGIAAVSTPDFAIMFFACQYAGLVAAPVPLPVTLGGRSSYERQLQRMADTGDFHALFCPDSMEPIMRSALNDQAIPVMTFESIEALPKGETLRPLSLIHI